MPVNKSNTGLIVAGLVIAAWLLSISMLMQVDLIQAHPAIYLLILLQMHLYTGLFITAHDAMHGTVSSNRTLNDLIGQMCTLLYALFPFRKLYTKHHEHHKHVHSEHDPDFHSGNFFSWYYNFIREYISWWQLVLMAVLFNVLKLYIPESNLLLFWVLPSLLSTLQLFYFGTWLPHHGEQQNIHRSGSLQKNHFLAFFTCYFFGYHYEHHDSPGTPWWKLWKLKDKGYNVSKTS